MKKETKSFIINMAKVFFIFLVLTLMLGTLAGTLEIVNGGTQEDFYVETVKFMLIGVVIVITLTFMCLGFLLKEYKENIINWLKEHDMYLFFWISLIVFSLIIYFTVDIKWQ